MIYGQGGENTLVGGDGADVIVQTAQGSAFAFGEGGDDLFVVRGDTDVATGEGRDTVILDQDLAYVTDFDPETDQVVVTVRGDVIDEDYRITSDGQDSFISRIEPDGSETQVGIFLGVSPEQLHEAGLYFVHISDIPDIIASHGVGGPVIPGAETEGQLLQGDEDDNLLTGEGGDDTILGEGGADTLSGGQGNDFISTGDDTIVYDNLTPDGGNRGPEDEAFGGAGDDTLVAGERDATLAGNEGNDLLIGGEAGIQILSGGDGDDVLVGREADTSRQELSFGVFEESLLLGGAGDDIIFDNGYYAADGGPGADSFVSNYENTFPTMAFDEDEDILIVGYEDGTEPPTVDDIRYTTEWEIPFRQIRVEVELLVKLENPDGTQDTIARITNMGQVPNGSPSGSFDHPAGTAFIDAAQIQFVPYSELAALQT